MRIRVSTGSRNINLILPTSLLFCPGTAWLAEHVGRKYSGTVMDLIPPHATGKLFAELRRIKRKHGTWNLVDIESSDGSKINITL